MSSPRRGRKPVFDPAALDDLDVTLAPPEPTTPTPVYSPRAPVDVLPSDDAGGGESADGPALGGSSPGPVGSMPTVDPPRSTGGSGSERGASAGRARPSVTSGARTHPMTSRQPRSTRGRIPTAVRLPADLYRQINEVLLSGSERPSYGQLVIWTVEDHRGEVTAQVEADLPDPSERVPRGRKLAQDRMPVGLQLLSSERDNLDELAAAVAERHEGARVTRTDVAIAALRVALRVRSSSHRPV